jgi:predicted DNA-binding transcriptional regulator YafY
MTTKKKYSQAARVQGILRTLGVRQGITISQLAEDFGVTKRTLYRDLKALEDSGYPRLSEIVEGTYPAARRGNGKTGRFSLLPK